MELRAELERVAAAVAARGEVTGVLAAEVGSGRRLYLVALGDGEERTWLVVDVDGAPVADRGAVREAASIVAMCELADELAGAATSSGSAGS